MRGEFQVDLAGEVHFLKGLVFADVAGDHLFDLLGGEEEAEAGAVDAGVVGDGGEAGDGGGGVDGVDEGVRDAGEAEAAGEEGAVGAHVGDGLGGGGEDFVDGIVGAGGGEEAGGRGLGGCELGTMGGGGDGGFIAVLLTLRRMGDGCFGSLGNIFGVKSASTRCSRYLCAQLLWYGNNIALLEKKHDWSGSCCKYYEQQW